MTFRRWILSFVFVMLTGMSLAAGFAGAQQSGAALWLEKVLIQEAIMNHVMMAYVDSISQATLIDGAIEGMVQKLDPHSSYMPPTRADEFKEKIRGDFEGIGITFAVINETITVIEVIEGGPSDGSGLAARDKIVRIDDKNAVGISQDEVRELLRGASGTRVDLGIERPGTTGLLTVTIRRGKVEVDSVSHAYMLDARTGYLALTSFTANSGDDVARALDKLKRLGMSRLVFDLRNNTGGSLEAAVEIVRMFVPDGLIVEMRGKRAQDNKKWSANGSATYTAIPMVVLINHASASASEIVAGALQDHDRALIAGRTSFGKGLVMNEFPIVTEGGRIVMNEYPMTIGPRRKYLGSLVLSVAHYYTPSGRLIQRPYDQGRSAYIEQGFDDIDPNALDSLKVDRPLYHTDLGRNVYGGGGITPDRNVPPARRLNTLESSLRVTNLAFEFADGYLERHDDIPDSFQDFLASYHIPAQEMARFKTFIADKGIDISYGKSFEDEFRTLAERYALPAESLDAVTQSLRDKGFTPATSLFDISGEFIESELKQELARMVWGSEERYRIWHARDTELDGALAYFGEAEAMLTSRLALWRQDRVPLRIE